ncbi:hypothetical protein V8C86DRAFT_2776255, partial [Haematococcus lacustris]
MHTGSAGVVFFYFLWVGALCISTALLTAATTPRTNGYPVFSHVLAWVMSAIQVGNSYSEDAMRACMQVSWPRMQMWSCMYECMHIVLFKSAHTWL